ncbi:MAG: type III pantothenate kinase [Rhodocyclaceae bacterium]|nr:MAG: type III pantothenate kinase [Rhodocyclaceae bacterium]
MLLCIDCGNSRLKWGLHDGQRWLKQAALPLAELDRLKQEFSALPLPSAVFACSVAGEQAHTAVERSVAALGLPLTWLVSKPAQCGVTNSYTNPAQLGADRWAAMIGARQLFQGDCLVVNAGTATTIDVLDRNGVFQGGLILPGIDLMRGSLASNTAQLPLAEGACHPLPRNTADAIVSGALLATAGAIARMFAHVAATPGAICLVTGGAAAPLLPVLEVPWRAVDHLVLEGLRQFASEGA